MSGRFGLGLIDKLVHIVQSKVYPLLIPKPSVLTLFIRYSSAQLVWLPIFHYHPTILN